MNGSWTLATGNLAYPVLLMDSSFASLIYAFNLVISGSNKMVTTIWSESRAETFLIASLFLSKQISASKFIYAMK